MSQNKMYKQENIIRLQKEKCSLKQKEKDEVNRKLAEIRKEYTIAKGQDPNKKDKYDKELINISFVK